MAPRGGKREWEIMFMPDAERWYRGLSAQDADHVNATLVQLRLHGPNLGRPRADRMKGSRHHNMKELRPANGNLRALFAFDPNRRAVVLLGGDKTNDWKGWYKRNLPVAERIFDRHLRDLGKGGVFWPMGKRSPGRKSDGRGR